MKITKFREYLGISNVAFYKLRRAGYIPEPNEGPFLRKTYSDTQIKDIKKRLIQLGVIK